MSNSATTVLLIGGPETGKTNYIVRLWLAMCTEKGGLKKSALPQQLDYLEAGAQTLLGGAFAGRTPIDTFTKIEIPFHLAETQKRGKLVVPDLSGEDCVRVYRNRRWNSDWEECISDCAGCMVFLRESVLHAPLSWGDVVQLYGAVREQREDASQPIPTQVLLVEWLQFLRHAFDDNTNRGHSFVPRIAIVIAAWDELGDEVAEQGPRAFLENYTPLLCSFIETNRDRFEVMAFGTSVVGGDFVHDQEFREQYLQGNPGESGYVIYELGGSSRKSGDITIPVAWILGSSLE